MASRRSAFGLSMAHLRVDTATCAHCSSVVPYTCMWRVVIMPKSVGAPPKPKGASNCPVRLVSRRGLTPTPERPDSPCEMTATLQRPRSEEHTSELQSHSDLVCRLLLEKKNE